MLRVWLDSGKCSTIPSTTGHLRPFHKYKNAPYNAYSLSLTLVLLKKDNANKVHHLPRGKMLGGSSGINFMAYVRPSAEDIDSWASQAPGWSWASLEPYFRKNESTLPEYVSNQRPDHFAQDKTFHGVSGPVQTSWPVSSYGIENAIVHAFNEVTISCQMKDPYDGQHLGLSQHLSTVDRRNGVISRSYAASGYLELCGRRPNLSILTEASACQILLDKPVMRAKGVKFRYKDSEHQVVAKCEIIIPASTIQSPRLLELSGIGKSDVLRSAGIPCLVDLPHVGENLQEHPLTCVTYELTNIPEHVLLDSLISKPDVLQANTKRLNQTQDGLLSGITGLIGFAPCASNVSEKRLSSTVDSIIVSQSELMEEHEREQSERYIRLLRNPQAPAIEVVGMPCNFDISTGHSDQSRLMPGPPLGSGDCYTVLVSSLYNMSRGNTHITPTIAGEIKAYDGIPHIDPALLQHPADVNVLAAGLSMADRAFRSESMSERIARRVVPPPEVDLEDETQARAYVQENIMMFNHNLGTCAMGRVVDERLRVKSVGGLRVVDCSVIPDQISANTMATVYALAERTADLIKEERRQKFF